jgi:hypothetical protein
MPCFALLLEVRIMNLVASAILRGMVGASSSADLSGVPGNKRAKSQDQAAGTSGESLRAAFMGGEDARAALKGIEAESGLKEKQGQGSQGWGFFRSRYADAVRISDAGKNAPGAAGVATMAQDTSTQAGKKLTIKA